ncbi:MAG: CBS domain-containing protein [Akkermansiaceae bacterium]|nr:CBS domain-containing protein [Akkermansiaceae bacterium]
MTEHNTPLKDVMTKAPQYIAPGTTLQEAAQQMRKLDTGFLPVGDGVDLKGMITDRDIVVRAVAENADAATSKVSDFITEEVLYAYEDQDVEFALKTMKSKQVRRLVIVNRDKDLVGVVSLGDLATRLGESEPKAKALEAVSRS